MHKHDRERIIAFVKKYKLPIAIVTTAVVVHRYTELRTVGRCYVIVSEAAHKWGVQAGELDVQLGCAYDFIQGQGLWSEFETVFEAVETAV